MTSIAISLGLMSVWAAGFGLAGAYWVRRERQRARRKRLEGQKNFNFSDAEYTPFAEHSLRR